MKMKELSIFIDESGDFGRYEPHSPYYILTLVFHNQSLDISENIRRFREDMTRNGMPEYTVHAGPLIRREPEYESLSFLERKKIFNSLFHFVRLSDITYHSIIIEKKQLVDENDLNIRITKRLTRFLKDNLEMFMQYDRIIAYYDYGQRELTSILVSLFNAFLNVEFKKVTPINYKLFQAADMFCTLELLSLKVETKTLSNSERNFFLNGRNLRKTYLEAIHRKRF
jgi:hypothetical protein